MFPLLQLLDLFVNGKPGIKKPIVFCPNNEIARRCLRLFKLLRDQRVRDAEDDERAEQVYVTFARPQSCFRAGRINSATGPFYSCYPL
jgi:hypothetical protein